MTVPRELHVAATWNGREMLRARLVGACSRYMLRAMTKGPSIGRHVRAAGAGQSGTSARYCIRNYRQYVQLYRSALSPGALHS